MKTIFLLYSIAFFVYCLLHLFNIIPDEIYDKRAMPLLFISVSVYVILYRLDEILEQLKNK